MEQIEHFEPFFDYDKCEKFLPLEHGEIAYCHSVYDGDSVRLCWRSKGKNVKGICRIMGIDTPEIRGSSDYEKELGIEAKNRLSEVVTGKFVIIKNPGFEKYGRILADLETSEIKSIKNFMLSDPMIARPYDGGKRRSWRRILN